MTDQFNGPVYPSCSKIRLCVATSSEVSHLGGDATVPVEIHERAAPIGPICDFQTSGSEG